ncbi:MAG: zinc-dependent metalloprotease [Acidimicrobiia bacterium]
MPVPVREPVDWPLAERIARRVAGRDALSSSYLARSLEPDFATATSTAESLVAEFTGLRAPDPARALVIDRVAWVSANVRAMRRMLAPFMDRIAARMSRSPWAPIGVRVSGAEVGVLLGYLARRVLGQYDLLVPDEGAGGGDVVYYVGPNVLSLEKQFAFRPRDFRLWIAIHEVTHRAQFTGVPWMQQYFLSLVEQSLSMLDPDPQRLVRALRRGIDELRAGRNPLDDGGLVALMATPEQRGVLSQVQALMSLLEGHGNAVMNRLGREHVAGQERMATVLQARRQQGGVSGQVQKLLGLEMKMRQYELGESFVDTVEREAGLAAIDRAWEGPGLLPSLEELAEPEQWLARIDRITPLASGR